jgi:hypothetical protein
MKIELCFLTVNVLAGFAEVTWYLQSLPGEKKVIFFLYFTANKEDECESQSKSSVLAFLIRLTTLLLILSTHRHSTNAADICQCCFCV